MAINTDYILQNGPHALLDTKGTDSGWRSLPATLFGYLPDLLARLVKTGKSASDQAVLLLTALVAASASMERVRGRYGTKDYAPHVMALVVGEPSSGKGHVRLAHDFLREVDLQYEGESDAADEGRARRSVIVSANASDRAFFNRVNANDGAACVIAPEIDTYLGTASNDWARLLSPLYREGFEHEPFSLDRADYSAIVPEPKLAVLMAGTPDQAINLLRSSENGLFSRFLILRAHSSPEWVSGRPTQRTYELDAASGEFAHLLGQIRHALQRRDELLHTRLTPDQWDAVDEVFGTWKATADGDPRFEGFVPSLHRGAVIAFRIAMLLTVLGTDVESLESVDHLELADADVAGALLLTAVLLDHAHRIYQVLPQSATSIDVNRAQEALHGALPSEFQRREAVDVGAEIGIAQRTVGKYLRRLVEDGKVYRVIGTNGVYRKNADGFKRSPIIID